MTAPTVRRLRMQATPRRLREQRAAAAAMPSAPPPPALAPPPPGAMARYLVVRLREDPPDDPAFAYDLRTAYLRYRALDFGILEVRP